VTRKQIKEIAELKMPDLNAKNLEGAMSMIEGTAKSLGLEVID
jgi:large subunit ribosomal protein L11